MGVEILLDDNHSPLLIIQDETIPLKNENAMTSKNVEITIVNDTKNCTNPFE